jgi:anti-anti-sigma factor
MSDGLHIYIEQQEAGAVVRLEGWGTLERAGEVQDRMDEVSTATTGKVVVDLSKLKFASSFVLGAIVKLRNELRELERPLLLAGAGGVVAEAIEKARLSQIIRSFESVDAAMLSG